MIYFGRPEEWRRPTVVAEIGGNHGGSMERAKELILAARLAGADYAKFQKRDVESMPEADHARPRSDLHAFGPTEYEHRKALEFSADQHADLKRYAESVGVKYACSAWDAKSAKDVIGLGVDYLKIPSAKNMALAKWGWGPLGWWCPVPVHISLGMTTEDERAVILDECSARDIPYVCTSAYPCDNDKVYLLEIRKLANLGQWRDIGFSGHHRGIQLDVAAYLLGATWFERHFTLDRAAKGTDHAASLEPDGLRKLVRDLAAVRSAMQEKPLGVPECESAMRKKFKGV